MLDTKVKDVVGIPEGPAGTIGIEIEVEAYNYLPDVQHPWMRTMDGSLRGRDNAEYVLREPLDKEAAFKAIDWLARAITGNKTRVKDTVRAGVHVHINMLEATCRQLWTYATCYYVLEEALTERFCGAGRVGNHFCLRAIDADVLTHDIGRVLRNDEYGILMYDDIRYSALNFTSLFRHGSVEFRALRTPPDLNRVKTWIDILLAIKANSKMFSNPREVVEMFSMGGEINFLNQILGPLSSELGERNERLTEMLRRGVRVAQEIAYARKEW